MKRNGEAKRINEIDIDLNRSFSMIRGKLCSDKEAESGAERYIRILHAPECREFFLKVMYHLPYDIRERILEASNKPWVKTPKKYFTFSAKKELSKFGF